MSGPYRESDATPQAPGEQVAWRRRVVGAAEWLVLFLVANIATRIGFDVEWLPRLGLPALAVVWFATYVGVAASTWSLAAPQPAARVHWLGWVLRAIVLAPLALAVVIQVGVAPLWLHGIALDAASITCNALVSLALLAYLARLFAAAGQRWRSREALLVGVGTFAFAVAFAVLGSAPWDAFTAIGFIWGFTLLWRLRRVMLVDGRYWWFDTEMEPPGEWVVLLAHRDKHAEILCIDETLGWFESEDEATEWLEDNGYVPAERALAEHLVDDVPPDVLPVARRRKRLRVAHRAARVRVEADPPDSGADDARDGVLDEFDENAVGDRPDTPGPPRTLTVEKPDEH